MATCNCGNSSNDSELNKLSAVGADPPCTAEVHETVCVQAVVSIAPKVTVGTISTTCVGGPVIGACPGTPEEFCTFTVSQNICVDIPLDFEATATAVPAGIVCGTPGTGPCVA